ncbi:MAG: DUF5076 domain-containing protein [Caulobacterales bacterium]|nr:DUF5076 domain-containing protein [Caulobacterales bacterium]
MPPREIRMPDGAVSGPHADSAVELMRAWWIHDRPEYVLSPMLKDPKNVGRMLYEAAFHFSNVYSSNGLGAQEDVLNQIKEGWDGAKEIPMATNMTTEAPAKKG